MKAICFWIVLILFCISEAQAETWVVRSLGPAGRITERRWELRETGTGLGYFLQGQAEPVYTLVLTPDGTQVTFANGTTRRFSSGFLLLTDLPMPVFVSGENALESGVHCFQEYVGREGFQACTEAAFITSLSEMESSSIQSGKVVLVWQKTQLKAIVGADFQAERIE